MITPKLPNIYYLEYQVYQGSPNWANMLPTDSDFNLSGFPELAHTGGDQTDRRREKN
jgi:hypothetical protein